MIFWGRKNIAGERSLKIPYGTIAVNTRIDFNQEHIQISYIGLNFWSTYSNQKQATIQNVECSFNGFKPYLAVVSVHFLFVGSKYAVQCGTVQKRPTFIGWKDQKQKFVDNFIDNQKPHFKGQFSFNFWSITASWLTILLSSIYYHQSIITYTHTQKSNFFQANSYSFTVSLIMHINRFAIAVLFPLVSTTASAAAAEVKASKKATRKIQKSNGGNAPLYVV